MSVRVVVAIAPALSSADASVLSQNENGPWCTSHPKPAHLPPEAGWAAVFATDETVRNEGGPHPLGPERMWRTWGLPQVAARRGRSKREPAHTAHRGK